MALTACGRVLTTQRYFTYLNWLSWPVKLSLVLLFLVGNIFWVGASPLPGDDLRVAVGTLPQIDVKGKVVNEKGEPVVGATVEVKGTNRATTTDEKGEFSLKGIDGNAVLVISGVNIETVEVKVNGRINLTVKAKARVKEETTVVVQTTVNTGYQRISKERFVGSVTKIDSALFNRQVSTNILSRLDGIANGLLFDHREGADKGTILIRGISTIQGDKNPLIVLDNFPFAGNINDINPNDVEDITILKDAAAASIWGARAANGVIVITTKRGKYNQPFSLSVSSNVLIGEKPRLFTQPIISTFDFIDLEQFLFNNGAYNEILGNILTFPIVSPVVAILAKREAGIITPEAADAQINSLRGLDVRNELDRYINKNVINQQNSFNLNGGSNLLTYSVSGGYDHVLPDRLGGTESNRYTLRMSSGFRPIKDVEIQTGIAYAQTNDQDNGGYSLPGYPYLQLADAAGNSLVVERIYRSSYTDTVGGGRLLDWQYRPLEELQNGYTDNTTKTQSLYINLGINWRMFPWLTGAISSQYGRGTGVNRSLQSLQSFTTRDIINQLTNLRQTQLALRNPVPIGDILDENNNSLTTYSLRGQLNFNKSWRGQHQLNGLVSAELGHSQTQSAGFRVYGYRDDILQYSNVDYVSLYPLFVGSGSGRVPSGTVFTGFTNRNVSFLANASYSYKNRYTAYASARRDGSNLFGAETNNKWKPLWSVGAGWDISKEKFYTISWLPSLKLRGSYGYLGIPPIVGANPTMQYQVVSVLTNSPTASLLTPANPTLQWEQTGTWNVGVDFAFLQNRISGGLEWYHKKSNYLIAGFTLDRTTGWETSLFNVADLKGSGIELFLSTQNISTGAFRWQTNFIFNHAKTIVTNYYNRSFSSLGFVGSTSVNPIVGGLAYGIYSYRWAGLDPENGTPRGYLNGAISNDYAAIVIDSIQHQVFHGSANPLYFGNILNTFSWKGFNLSANITYRLNYYFRKPTFNGEVGSLADPLHSDYYKRWQQPGDEAYTTVPAFIYPVPLDLAQSGSFYENSEINVERADHIRLQDVRLSYGWNRKNNSKAPVKNIQVFVIGNNLGILWRANRSGLDPESPTIRSSRSIAVGLSTNF